MARNTPTSTRWRGSGRRVVGGTSAIAAAGASSANSIRPRITHANGGTSSNSGAHRPTPNAITSGIAARHPTIHHERLESHSPTPTPAAPSATTPAACAQGTSSSMA
jgi:hypothetical protein